MPSPSTPPPPPPPLPLALAELPKSIQRFCDPNAPTPARLMAARGLVPVKGSELVTLLVQLSRSSDTTISTAAAGALADVPEQVLLAACEAPLHPSILHELAYLYADAREALERITVNHATSDATVELIARTCDEKMSERIATNEQRLLACPAIIEALYRNRSTRMSTADRLIELALRNEVVLAGIAGFEAHVAAIRGQLLPEPTDQPLPSDLLFKNVLAQDRDADVYKQDEEEGTEELEHAFKPLAMQIADMNLSEKARLATIGSSAARAILVRDPNRHVSRTAIESPQVTRQEAAKYARSREMSEDVLRYIGTRRDWTADYEVQRGLVFNPKTPIGVSLKWLLYLRPADLKNLSRSRNVSGPVKTAATAQLAKRERRG